ncbi:MAG: hypothetical protein KTR32_08085 [Granulosicoccus sp.]|nr:hypothetical protein [Granulosicoccus sp.]
MKMDLLFLLPTLAVLICLTGAVVPLTVFGARDRRKYTRDTIITARFTVAALILATIITMIRPVPGVGALFQGLVITFICLIPLIIFHLVSTVRHLIFSKTKRSSRRKRRVNYRRASERETLDHDQTIDVSQLSGQDTASIETAVGELEADAEPVPVVSRPLDTTVSNMKQQAQDDLTRSKRKSKSRRTGVTATILEDQATQKLEQPDPDYEVFEEKQDPELKEQMDRVSTLVKSYDLGDEKSGSARRRSRAIHDNSATAISAKDQPTELESHNEKALQVSRTEALRKVIATLQDDKRKLQRLVIAQQAAFDSERQSHERTRHVARDAIKVMRDARSGQRMAEKIARRERAERRRLEKEYTKVTRALKNAMSTLATAEANSGKDSNSTSAA